VDKNFFPVAADEGDELYPNGIFVFNITKMSEFIRNNPGEFKIEVIAVKDYINPFTVFAEAHLETIQDYPPVILAEISPGRFNVIDGNHRMEKARRSGMETLNAYKLGPQQHMRFLISEKAYVTYVQFWNEKLKNQERMKIGTNPPLPQGIASDPRVCRSSGIGNILNMIIDPTTDKIFCSPDFRRMRHPTQ
jgi:hypothetical protein